jgi:hypothetical protein
MLVELQVNWFRGVVEYIELDDAHDFSRKMATIERWSGSGHREYVDYVARAKFARKGDSRTLRLTYKQNDQEDLRVVEESKKGVIPYGTATLKWKDDVSSAYAIWKGDKAGKNPTRTKVIVTPSGALDKQKRGRRLASALERLRQREFRDLLVHYDHGCVLTGETCLKAVEAAHIRSVAESGTDRKENGILLRADLHLLFDAKIIWFDAFTDHAAVRYSSDLTPSYVKLLRDKMLPTKTFARVKKNLQKQSRKLRSK